MVEKYWEPLGQALTDYYYGNQMTTVIVESNAEPDRHVPASIFFREGRLPRLEKIALKYCKGKILEIGAGAGPHSLKLQEKGYDITAMDINESLVKLMEARGLKKVVCSDIFRYGTDTPFDTLLMLMNGIGVAGNLAGLPLLLKKCKELLKPNGQIICDSTDIAYVTHKLRLTATLPFDPDTYYGDVWYRLKYKNKAGEPYPWLFVDKNILAGIAKTQGFKLEVIAEQEHQYVARLTLTH